MMIIKCVLNPDPVTAVQGLNMTTNTGTFTPSSSFFWLVGCCSHALAVFTFILKTLFTWCVQGFTSITASGLWGRHHPKSFDRLRQTRGRPSVQMFWKVQVNLRVAFNAALFYWEMWTLLSFKLRFHFFFDDRVRTGAQVGVKLWLLVHNKESKLLGE